MNPIVFTNLQVMRHQECDRISAMAEGLTKVGVKVVEGTDWLAIFPLGSTDNDVAHWKTNFMGKYLCKESCNKG